MGRTARLLAFSVPAAVCAAWTVVAGKDVNWDLLNYHYYLPFELIAGRLEQDFFAASAQSYLNPVGFLPFYLIVSWGCHSVLASIALAIAHSSTLALLYFVAWRLFAHLAPSDRVVFSCLATVTGAATAVFWATVGGSFLDPLLVPLMLGGLLLLLGGGPGAAGRAVLAGALFGAAAALKYSNAVFALAAFPLVPAMPGLSGGRARLRAGLGYVAGGAVAVGVLAGPWFVLLYREFANPVFPLMNAWFQSPYAPPVNMVSERFAPGDWIAVLAFPFRMAALDRSLYSEMFAPDVRFAALTLVALALPVVAARRRAAPSGLKGVDWRVFAFFGISCALWLATSANGRYGMVVLLLAGVCLARLAERLLPAGVARGALLVVLAVQIGTSILASPPRWFIADAWSKRWLPYDVPERAQREPALYLTLEVPSMSAIAPLVHPGSSFVNFRGGTSISPDSPRLAELLERHRGHVRVLGRWLELVDGKPRDAVVRAFDDTLVRIGYRLDTSDCFTIAWNPDGDDPVSRAANWIARRPAATDLLSAVSCALRPAERDPARAEAERRASALFDRMEKSCPQIFRGQTAVTEPLGGGWSRNYVGLDARLEAIGDSVVLNRYRAGILVHLGRLSDWEGGGAVPSICGEQGGRGP